MAIRRGRGRDFRILAELRLKYGWDSQAANFEESQTRPLRFGDTPPVPRANQIRFDLWPHLGRVIEISLFS